ncbi:hypothetical protein R5W23_002303 [Gemmata sp. JC673]|uniref:Uncharacterized protein n=1 Tax=Gemmata algarum TaxID=2975278 RepID=A0ABU5F5A4_9BACT|nr:hypothetical protein [Gemmata algarum]MDY3561044.1 hypothetical protein [Gemmata algarum]
MPDEQPRYFTAIDMFWEVFHVAVVSTGCYLGSAVCDTYLAMLFGGLVARLAGVTLVLGIRRLSGVRN